jgi:hypothetical protein
VNKAELDRDIAEDFQERQAMNGAGSRDLADKLRDHTALSTEDSAGDVDAAWDLARESGEEAFTGHAPTPDQDRVDDLGAAAGLTYKDDEPLQYRKVSHRDDQRWELDPRSGQAEPTIDEPTDEADDGNAPLRFWDLADDLDAEVEEEYNDDEDDEDDEADEDEADDVDDLDDELLRKGEGDVELGDEDEAVDADDEGDFDNEALDDELDEDLETDLDDLEDDEDDDDDDR